VLCGGRSSRFGRDKALAPFGSSTVGGRVVAALRGAGIDPVVAIGGSAGDAIGLPTVPDRRPGEGPLGGLATALLWARRGWVVVVPCDLPLLGVEHVELLLAAGPEDRRPIVATVDGRPNVSLSLWPADAGRRILELVDGGERRFRAALEGERWRGVEVPAVALADADTPEELARLQEGTG
jgi:molybdopterin-guanine dinucleotide biosynthesis protein A